MVILKLDGKDYAFLNAETQNCNNCHLQKICNGANTDNCRCAALWECFNTKAAGYFVAMNNSNAAPPPKEFEESENLPKQAEKAEELPF